MKKFSFAIILFLATAHSSLFSQEVDNRLKSIYVYNFTKYLDWPSESKKGEFIIGVFANQELYLDFLKLCDNKKVGLQKITIKQITTIEEAASCQIVFIPRKESSKITGINETTKNLPVLVVSEKDGWIKKGSSINIFIDDDDDNKTKFELNKRMLEMKGIKVGNALIPMAAHVYK